MLEMDDSSFYADVRFAVVVRPSPTRSTSAMPESESFGKPDFLRNQNETLLMLAWM
jgi:hypothetical protein